MATIVCIADNRELDNISADEICELSLFGDGETYRLQKIKNPRRRAESATGLICLRNALRYLNLTKANKSFEIVRDADGRPSFADIDLPDFSITHDGFLSVAVIEDTGKRVGADIEQTETEKGKIITDSQKKLADRFFSTSEKERLHQKAYLSDEFFKIWTEKEAYAKMCGKGLSKILSEQKTKENENAYLRCFEITYKKERYILTLCTANTEIAEIIFPAECTLNEIK